MALLTNKYSELVYEGWGAVEQGSFNRAEEHFTSVLSSQDDPSLKALDLIDAHNGMGVVSLSHRDLFDALRWYHEAKYLFEQHYGKKKPVRLKWDIAEDRPLMRYYIGHGNAHYVSGNTKKAQECYLALLERDPSDALGAKKYLEGIEEEKLFEEVR